MLTKAIIKWRIKALNSTIYRMGNAGSNINTLCDNIEKLKKVMESNIKINDAVPYQDTMNNSKDTSKSVQQNLSNRVVPSLYYRVKEYKKKLEE